jgi:Domain of unknown function (DUF4390)
MRRVLSSKIERPGLPRREGSMKRGWCCCVLLALLVTSAVPARGARLVILGIGATSQGYPYVEFDFQEPFGTKAREAIRSGLPSTLTFTIEVWHQRTGWWDALEETREIQFRVLRDLLNDQYVVVTPEEVRRFPDLESLGDAVCRARREYLRPLDPDKSYYVVVNANLAPLSVEDLKELERWLQGTLRSGDEEGSGRVAGISGTMVGLLLSMTGFGDETYRARSVRFVPRELPKTPPPSAGGVAPADSSSGGAPQR